LNGTPVGILVDGLNPGSVKEKLKMTKSLTQEGKNHPAVSSPASPLLTVTAVPGTGRPAPPFPGEEKKTGLMVSVT